MVKPGYNESSNLTGLTTGKDTAETMILKFHKFYLKPALRFDTHVNEITANQ